MRLYHNPRCSKSRQAVALLNDSGIDFEEYRYLDNGIAPEDLEILLTLEGSIRTDDIADDVVLDIPKLLQRPILINDGKAVIGRPPEEILTLLPVV